MGKERVEEERQKRIERDLEREDGEEMGGGEREIGRSKQGLARFRKVLARVLARFEQGS